MCSFSALSQFSGGKSQKGGPYVINTRFYPGVSDHTCLLNRQYCLLITDSLLNKSILKKLRTLE